MLLLKLLLMTALLLWLEMSLVLYAAVQADQLWWVITFPIAPLRLLRNKSMSAPLECIRSTAGEMHWFITVFVLGCCALQVYICAPYGMRGGVGLRLNLCGDGTSRPHA